MNFNQPPKNPNTEKLPSENKIEKSQAKEGIDFVFEQNPELSHIGTKEQYSMYLETVFPESVLKNIFWHKAAPRTQKFEGGDWKMSRLGGAYFSFKNIPTGGLLGNVIQKFYKEATINAVLNVKKPFIVDRNNAKEVIKKIGFTTQNVTKLKQKFDLSEHDSILGFPNESKDQGQLDNFPEIKFNEKDRVDIIELAVFDPEQIHILGSRSDLENFKQFVENQKTPDSSIS